MPFNFRSIIKGFRSNTTSRRRVAEASTNVESMEQRALLSAANFGFANSFEGGAVENANDVATDADGNIYTVGSFSGTTDFDPGNGSSELTSQGGLVRTDGFISKLDADGDFVAVGQFASDNDVDVTGIAIDSAGNLYVTGQYSDTTDFDPTAGVTTMNGAAGDAFLAKLDSSLNLQWVNRFAGNGAIRTNGVAVDADGNAYIAGWFSKTIDFLSGPGTKKKTAVGKQDGYVAKFDTNGNSKFISRFEGDSGLNKSRVVDIDADSRGNLYLTGWFGGDVDFDPKSDVTMLSSEGGRDAFVTHLDRQGRLSWVRQIGGIDGDEGRAIAIDQATNDVYVGSTHVGTVDFDPTTEIDNRTTSSTDRVNGHESFITRYDSSGTRVFTNQFSEGNGDLGVTALAVDEEGDFYVTGGMSGQIDFDANTNVANFDATAGQDVFAAKYNSDGEFIWAGLGDPEYATGIAVAEGGAVHVVGEGSGGSFENTTVGSGAYVWQTIQTVVYELPEDVTDVVVRRNGGLFEVYDAITTSILESGDISTTAGLVLDGSQTSSLNVTVDYDHGGAFTLPAGIDIDGNNTSDDVKVVGTAGLKSVYWTEQSEIIVNGGTDVRFTNFEQLDMYSFEESTLRSSDNNDRITVTAVSDLAGGEFSGLVAGKNAGVDFVQLRVYDVPTFNIRMAAADDQVSFDSNAFSMRGLTNLAVFGAGGDDTMSADGSDLTLDVSGGLLSFDGGSGNDMLAIEGDVDMELDTDRLTAGGAALLHEEIELAQLIGGDSANVISARKFEGQIVAEGRGGDDTVIGSKGGDTLSGGSGADAINGREGSDVIRGGSGEDTIRGNSGNDRIGGGNDKDIIYGQKGSDTLMGGAGADELDGGADNDALHGEEGSDMYVVDADNDANELFVALITGNVVSIEQTIAGERAVSERDTIEQDADDEVFVNLFAGDDTINVAANVTLDGTVDGGGGSDTCNAPNNWDSVNC